MEAYVEDFLRVAAEQGLDVFDELTKAPWIEDRGSGLVDVVFEGKPESRRRKDIMVWLVGSIPDEARTARECFYDLVADRPHRGSIIQA